MKRDGQDVRLADRNGMAHSIESRLPFMDYRIVELCFSLPDEMKIRNGETKWILRRAMDGILPPQVRDRRDKVGFSTPEDAWFRSEFREMTAVSYTHLTLPTTPYV